MAWFGRSHRRPSPVTRTPGMERIVENLKLISLPDYGGELHAGVDMSLISDADVKESLAELKKTRRWADADRWEAPMEIWNEVFHMSQQEHSLFIRYHNEALSRGLNVEGDR